MGSQELLVGSIGDEGAAVDGHLNFDGGVMTFRIMDPLQIENLIPDGLCSRKTRQNGRDVRETFGDETESVHVDSPTAFRG